MIVKSLELKDYRNYDRLHVQFHEGINILYGENAQGKTNLLEAIYFSGTVKSHRGSRDRELIRFNKEEAHIRTITDKGNVSHRIDIHLKLNKSKGAAIDGIPVKRQGDLFGMLNLVFFSPEDLYIIKNGPAHRRRFLDLELCQLDKVYLYHLNSYNKALMQRNNLLKQITHDRSLLSSLSIWDEKLAEHGQIVINTRDSFINSINEVLISIHKKLTGGSEELLLLYEPDSKAEDMLDILTRSRDKDLILKTTTAGPHRDDMSFMSNNIDLRKFGSQGQQRTAALSLKLAEIELVKAAIKENPVLLLDDVLSELDRNRQNLLLNSIGGLQTIITCTGLEEFISHRFEIDKIFHVENGSVTCNN